MSHMIIGTAGHVDHGKTALIKALTGVDTDRLTEEKRRGITIEIGFASLECPGGEPIGIIDVPGHEKFIKNMLAGIGGIDLALLVVAADEGVMPQTLEHFSILRSLGIKQGVIALTKADLATEEWLLLVEEEVKELVSGTFLQEAPVIPVSVKDGRNIELLRETLCEMAGKGVVKRESPELMRIPIDRVFTIAGFGTVATGTLSEGSIAVGDEVTVYPEGKTAKVRNLQVFGASVQQAWAGQRTAVNLGGIKKEELQRGKTLAAAGSMHPTSMIDTSIQVFPETSRSIESGSRVHMHYGASETLAKVVLLGGDSLAPGEAGFAQLRFSGELAIKRGDRLVLRFFSPLETIGSGVVLDISPEKHRPTHKDAAEMLHRIQTGGDSTYIEEYLKRESRNAPAADELALLLGMTIEESQKILHSLVSQGRVLQLGEGRYIHPSFGEHLCIRAEEILNSYRLSKPLTPGMPATEFKEKLSSSYHLESPGPSEGFLDHLIGNGILTRSGNLVSRKGAEVEITPEQQMLMEGMQIRFEAAGFEALSAETLFEDMGLSKKDRQLAQQMLESMTISGQLVKLEWPYFMAKEPWEKATNKVMEQLDEDGAVTLAQMRDVIGSSRKYALLILEAMDERKITRLVGERRIKR